MPRMPRRFEEGRVYHVYNRFSRGEPIFEETVEVGCFLDLLSEVKQTNGFALLAFCILPTHYHIAFRQGPVSLLRTMRSLQGRFSQSSTPAFWDAAADAAGDPASHDQRGRAVGRWKDCDHADRTPAACLVAWRAAPVRPAAGVARRRHCAQRAAMSVG